MKKFFAKWFPVAGSIALSLWSKYFTQKTGENAVDLFSKNIVFSEEFTGGIDNDIIQYYDETELNVFKIKKLINLMKIDGSIDVEKKRQINLIIENSNFPDPVCNELIGYLEGQAMFDNNLCFEFKDDDDRIGLLIDLVSLSKADGIFHEKEKSFIMDMALKTGFRKQEILAFLR